MQSPVVLRLEVKTGRRHLPVSGSVQEWHDVLQPLVAGGRVGI